MRSSDTNGPPNTLADLVKNNKWRQHVAGVSDSPIAHGIAMPEGVTNIPQGLRECTQRDPSASPPPCEETYELPAVLNVYIAFGCEKHCITGTTVTNVVGEMLILQTLWKGTTERCEPKFPTATAHLMSSIQYHDHAANKTPLQATNGTDGMSSGDQELKRSTKNMHFLMALQVLQLWTTFPVDNEQLIEAEGHLYKVLDLDGYHCQVHPIDPMP